MRFTPFRSWPAALFAAALAIPAAARAEPASVYTKFDLGKACATIATDPMGGTWQCPGHAGYAVVFSEGDLRQSVFYGHLGSWYAAGAWASFSGFNHVGDTIEWRIPVPGGPPTAAIQRWFIDRSAIDEAEAQVLVISRVGQPGEGEACVAGYVDALANKDANVIARRVADDIAPGFACRKAEPQWHGATSANMPMPFSGYTEESDPGTEDTAD